MSIKRTKGKTEDGVTPTTGLKARIEEDLAKQWVQEWGAREDAWGGQYVYRRKLEI